MFREALAGVDLTQWPVLVAIRMVFWSKKAAFFNFKSTFHTQKPYYTFFRRHTIANIIHLPSEKGTVKLEPSWIYHTGHPGGPQKGSMIETR